MGRMDREERGRRSRTDMGNGWRDGRERNVERVWGEGRCGRYIDKRVTEI